MESRTEYIMAHRELYPNSYAKLKSGFSNEPKIITPLVKDESKDKMLIRFKDNQKKFYERIGKTIKDLEVRQTFYECKKCKKLYKSEGWLIKHTLKHHPYSISAYIYKKYGKNKDWINKRPNIFKHIEKEPNKSNSMKYVNENNKQIRANIKRAKTMAQNGTEKKRGNM